jgi:hypothetical protein
MSRNHGRDAPATNLTKKLPLFEVPFRSFAGMDFLANDQLPGVASGRRIDGKPGS